MTSIVIADHSSSAVFFGGVVDETQIDAVFSSVKKSFIEDDRYPGDQSKAIYKNKRIVFQEFEALRQDFLDNKTDEIKCEWDNNEYQSKSFQIVRHDDGTITTSIVADDKRNVPSIDSLTTGFFIDEGGDGIVKANGTVIKIAPKN